MNDVLTFDQTCLIEQLNKLAPRARLAFAASCAERLLPGYFAYAGLHDVGNPEALRFALDGVWRVAQGGAVDFDPEEQFERCAALVPGDEEMENEGVEAADDAAAAVAYAVKAVEGYSAQDASICAYRVYESLDSYVSTVLGVEDEAAIVSHPLIQAEFKRQQRDLDELFLAASDLNPAVTLLHERATSEARSLYGPMS